MGDRQPDGFAIGRDLRTLHRVWAAALGALVLLALAPLLAEFVGGAPTDPPAGPDALPVMLPVILLASLAVATCVGVVATDRLFVATPPTDDADAIRRLQVRSVLQYTLAEFPVILGVLLAVLIGPAWLAAVPAPVAGLALVLAAPTEQRLRRLDAGWERDGHDVSLLRGLGSSGGGPDASGPGGRDG